MKFEDLKTKSTAELHQILSEKRDELRVLKFKAADNQLNDVKAIGKLKKTVARILTLLNQNK